VRALWPPSAFAFCYRSAATCPHHHPARAAWPKPPGGRGLALSARRGPYPVSSAQSQAPAPALRVRGERSPPHLARLVAAAPKGDPSAASGRAHAGAVVFLGWRIPLPLPVNAARYARSLPTGSLGFGVRGLLNCVSPAASPFLRSGAAAGDTQLSPRITVARCPVRSVGFGVWGLLNCAPSAASPFLRSGAAADDVQLSPRIAVARCVR